MRSRHLLGRRCESVAGRLEALQQCRPQQPYERSFAWIGSSAAPVLAWRIPRQAQNRLALLRRQSELEVLEKARKLVVQRIIDRVDVRRRKLDRYFAPSRIAHPIVRIVTAHKMPRAAHRGRIEYVEQGIRRQVVRILLDRISKLFSQRAQSEVRQGGVLLQKVRKQVVKIPERIVDRRCRKQDQRFGWMAFEQLAQRLGPTGKRIAEGLSLVNHHQGIVVRLLFKVTSGPAELNIIGEFFVGHALHVQRMHVCEPLPCSVAQGRWSNQKRPLAPALDGVLEQLASHKGFSEADPIGDKDAVVAIADAPCADDSVRLEGRELNPAAVGRLILQFGAVTLPEHTQENQIWVVSLKPRGV